ncbi:hypothetical protein FHP29_12980 [Nocardioides albidus]|uniref:GNAT family N-acetyltransferase n=1 Tax=Nocardioides albidus TaxID=1517589 RepID=A0A5C4VWE8_9ACTN|nr:hypothetical protein [Nocardioides albidus]TNM39766.1 hypothetical protein FHP29_12980 [Nocardioides albidus]
MIRERREQDLGRLADMLLELPDGPGVLAGRSPRTWLTEIEADLSWVFDQAPVSVAPTRNVVGHVQVYRPPADVAWVDRAAEAAGVAPERLLVIGRLFVRRMKHDQGIARYLLKEAVGQIAAQGQVAVLDPDGLALVPPALVTRLRFAGDPPVLGPLSG